MEDKLNKEQLEIPVSPQKAPNEIEETKKMSKKLVLAVSLILAIIIPITIYVYAKNKNSVSYNSTIDSPTSATPIADPTADWQIYVNTAVGFSIKYPSRFGAPGLPGGPIGPTDLANGSEDNTEILFGTNSLDSFGVVVSSFSGTLQDLINTTDNIPPYNWTGNQDVKILSNTKIQVSGVDGIWINAVEKSDPKSVFSAIFFVNKNHSFVIDSSTNYSQKELNQILSTFQFTGQTNLQNSTEASEIEIKYSGKNIALNILGAKTISSSEGHALIEVNGSTFDIKLSAGADGPCYQGRTDGCTYTDESFLATSLKMSPLRIWKNNTGVFMVNPQSVNYNNSYVTDSILITKTSPSETFTNDEVSIWKNALQTLKLK